MQGTSFLIRKKPSLELILNEHEFKILDGSKEVENATYKYECVNSLEIKYAKIDWITTLISILVEFFLIESSLGTIKKNKAKLLFNYKNERKEISLENYDKRMLIKLDKQLRSKLKTTVRRNNWETIS